MLICQHAIHATLLLTQSLNYLLMVFLSLIPLSIPSLLVLCNISHLLVLILPMLFDKYVCSFITHVSHTYLLLNISFTMFKVCYLMVCQFVLNLLISWSLTLTLIGLVVPILVGPPSGFVFILVIILSLGHPNVNMLSLAHPMKLSIMGWLMLSLKLPGFGIFYSSYIVHYLKL